jgi:hypothetical protein
MEVDKKLFFHFLDMTILNSFLLLTSCGAKMTHRDFRLALVRNLIEDAGSLRRPLGRPAGPDRKVSRLEVNFSNHWPVRSSRVNCRTCSARGIRKRVQIKCKECDMSLCIGECFKVYHKNVKLWRIEECWDVSEPQNISPNNYVQESCTYCAVSFAEWYTTAPECAKPRVWVLRRIDTGILMPSIWVFHRIKVKLHMVS